MNSVLDLDPIIEHMVTQATAELIESHIKGMRYMASFGSDVRELARALLPFDPMQFRHHGQSYLYISFVGDKLKFTRIFAALTRLGFSGATKPDEKSSSYSTFLSKTNGMQVYFSFESTTCRKVQTGTKTVEVPIYEIQCGDIPEFIPDPQIASEEEIKLLSDDIPF